MHEGSALAAVGGREAGTGKGGWQQSFRGPSRFYANLAMWHELFRDGWGLAGTDPRQSQAPLGFHRRGP